MKRFVLLMGAAAIISPAYGQLYLVQGHAAPKDVGGYVTSLLRMDSGGSMSVVSQILPGGRDGGTEWIGTSLDAGKAVLLTKPPNHTVKVLDFSTASVTKSCEPPPAPAGMGDFPFEEWLADIPGKGLAYVEHFGTSDQKKLDSTHLTGDDYAIRGMLLDATIPCDQSFFSPATNDVKFLVYDGAADLGSSVAKDVGIGADGAPAVGWFGGERTYFDYRVPDGVMRGIAQPNASVVLNNSQLFGAFVSDRTNGQWSLSILRKADNTWHTVPGVGTGGPFVRGFGSFVALTETQPKTAQSPRSAGQAEWRKTPGSAGPSLEARIGGLPYVLPGKLHLYDVAAEKMYDITTNQGDSEIVLVDNNTVYYRVSERLYSAAIGNEGLEPAKLLATSESIRDVHWAFVKH